MVRHAVIGPDLHTGLSAMGGQQIAIDFLVARLEKDRLAPIASRGEERRERRCGRGGPLRKPAVM